MAPLLSLNRSRSDLTLHATEPDGEPTVAPEPTTGPLPVSWPIIASVMGLVAALVGWVLCAGLSALAWVGAEPTVSSGRLGDALGVGTQLWLLANGAGAHLGRLQPTLVPWGATALFAFVLAPCTGFAARASRLPAPERAGRARAGIPMLATVSYLVAVGVASVLLGGPVL